MRYAAWRTLFGAAAWLATHGPRRANGDRALLPVARRAYRLSNRLWRDEWSPDW